MNDLGEILLNAASRDDISTAAQADLGSLNRALAQGTLRDLVESNHSDFTAYLSTLSDLEALWRPLEVEYAQRQVYGDPYAATLSKLSALIKDPEARKIDESDYSTYLEKQMGRKAGELARLPDYEKCTASITDGEYTIQSVISQKTRLLVEFIEKCLESAPKAGSEKIYKAAGRTCLLFLEVFKYTFATQLQQLPHLAALFYNDSQYLSIFICLKGGNPEDIKETLKLIGTQIFQNSLDRNLNELDEILNPKAWSLRYGQLDQSSLAIVQKIIDQALLRVGQIRKVWVPILDVSVFAEVTLELLEKVLNWLWKGLFEVKSMSRDVLPLFPEFVQSLNRPCMEILGPDLFAKRQPEICKKLDCVVKISLQNLIQVSNSFRREEFIDTLTLTEFRALIDFMFPESAMKTAFLAEIEAEID